MRVWRSAGGVLHGYPKIMPPQDEPLDIPETGIRQYAAAGSHVVCMCLEHKLTGTPDPRLVFVTAPAGEA